MYEAQTGWKRDANTNNIYAEAAASVLLGTAVAALIVMAVKCLIGAYQFLTMFI